ncbi:MAG TPA: hypothetical protein VGD59_03860 [Acidisarcina sp.]
MPTATTLPLIILMIFLWRITKGEILPCVLFTSIFTAASALNFGPWGVAPWLFVLGAGLLIRLLRGHRPYRFAMGANRVALHLVIIFLAYAAFTGFIYPVLFHGVTVMRLGDEEPLVWGLSNVAQLCYLLASAILYFLAVACTREELKRALEWYVRGCIVAALFAMYQLLNAVAHIPYPDKALYSNPSHVVYRAYMINGIWRLNSTFNEASEMAGFMIVGLALLGWTIMTSPLRFWRTCCFALMLLSLLLTISSVGYLCLGYMLIMGAVFYTRHMFHSRGLSAAKLILSVVLLTSGIAIALVSTQTVHLVNQVITSTILDKKSTDSYRERVHTHVAALQTLSQTHYMGAGWGSVRASGLIFFLLGSVGVPGVIMFFGFIGSLFLPLFRRAPPGQSREGRSLIETSLFAMSTLLLAMGVAGAEPVAPILWVLFGVATVAYPPMRTTRRVSYTAAGQPLSTNGTRLASTVSPANWQVTASSNQT